MPYTCSALWRKLNAIGSDLIRKISNCRQGCAALNNGDAAWLSDDLILRWLMLKPWKKGIFLARNGLVILGSKISYDA